MQVKISSSTSIVIGSTLFALASSAFLCAISGAPIDRSLRGVFRHWQGNAYVRLVKYPDDLPDAKLYEDEKQLGPSNCDPQEIDVMGAGRYRLYRDPASAQVPILMFSSSDNTDPNTNGRKYRLE